MAKLHIQKSWEAYRKTLPENLLPQYVDELRDSFYGGAIAMFSLVGLAKTTDVKKEFDWYLKTVEGRINNAKTDSN